VSFDDSMWRASEARLWALIEERTGDGADIEAIDARIWELFGERWAIMFTDLEGFSRKTSQFGIIHFLQIILTSKRILLPVAVEHLGLLVKSEGDSLLLLFRNPARAVRCAVDMQRIAQMASNRLVPEEQMGLSIGIGYGDLIRVGEHDVFGREVNAASKLGEDTAAPHEILITEAVREAVGELEDLSFEPIEVEAAGSRINHRVIYPRPGR
jgi:class 3 adenylate cyclase